MRSATSPDLPPISFFIVGAMKCGTTALVHALAAHSRIFLPLREVHFFDRDDLYLECFDGGRVVPERVRAAFGRHFDSDKPVLGSKVPSYLASTQRLERLQRFYPDARIVVMLRDPVDRAQSHWNHLLRAHGRGNVPDGAVAPDFSAKAAADRAEIERAESLRAGVSFHNVLQRGLYAEQLRTLYRLFPRDRVLVGEQRTLDRQRDAFLDEVQSFLGVTPEPIGRVLDTESPGRRPHTSVLSSNERALLRAFYAEPDAELTELLQRKFSWME